jgi:hypothetical protein
MDTNPYQAPTVPTATLTAPAPAPGTRPTILTVLGILNLIFGCLGVFGLLATVAMLAMPSAFLSGTPNPVLDTLRVNDAYQIFTIAATGLGFLAIIVLIASGVGLLRMRAYGRTLAIGYSIYALLAGVVGLVVNFLLVFGPMLQTMQGLNAPQRAAAMGGLVGGLLGGAVGLVYPAILLYCMFLPSVVSALRR